MSYYTTIGPLGTDVSSDELTFGTWEKIVDTTVSPSAVTTITITGLDLDAAKAYLLIFKTDNTTASLADYQLFFNNDTTTTNYYTQVLGVYGTTVAAGRANTTYLARAAAGVETWCYALIQRSVDGYAGCFSHEIRNTGSAVELYQNAMTYTVTGNVTRIDITSSVSGGIAVGSRIIIFKVSK